MAEAACSVERYPEALQAAQAAARLSRQQPHLRLVALILAAVSADLSRQPAVARQMVSAAIQQTSDVGVAFSWTYQPVLRHVRRLSSPRRSALVRLLEQLEEARPRGVGAPSMIRASLEAYQRTL